MRLSLLYTAGPKDLATACSFSPGWAPRDGNLARWQIDHFVGYFILTLIFCFAWARPLVVAGALVVFAIAGLVRRQQFLGALGFRYLSRFFMASGSWRWVNFPAQRPRGGPLVPFRNLATGYILISTDFAQSFAKEAGISERRRRVSDGRFKKGPDPRRGRGRPKGSPNVITPEMREAIIEAAAIVGSDGRGKGGLVGYMTRLARMENPVIFGRLVRKSIPLLSDTSLG